ncbi:hypothetical protein [Burkholderia sp. Ac-20353]|uniref:hypothetical protein n=1 Tax=Burkholderia sp. Ac-20353 TaxID=2703894 RepID=UPI00197B0DEF|nr:hypothetical protein [Burkholderia sp. Ac-20353]MBN3785689.1 hypothetical protein [Burkholderia sp. Ac-20353]
MTVKWFHRSRRAALSMSRRFDATGGVLGSQRACDPPVLSATSIDVANVVRVFAIAQKEIES